MSLINDAYLGLTKMGDKPQKAGYHTTSLEHTLDAYMSIRFFLGVLGISLPFILFLGGFIFFGQAKILPSISDYYYTPMGTIFTGFICAIAIFLFHYNAEEKTEKRLSRFASLCIFLVAIIPTTLCSDYCIVDGKQYNSNYFTHFIKPAIPNPNYWGYIHLVLASLFFIILIVIVLHYFTKHEKRTDNNETRIRFYKISGYGMLCAIVFIFIVRVFFNSWSMPATFLGETIILFFFGIAWLVKGKVDTAKFKALIID